MPKGRPTLLSGQARNDNYFADNDFRLLTTDGETSTQQPWTQPIVIISAPVCRNFRTQSIGVSVNHSRRYANRRAGSGTIFGQSALHSDRRASRKLVPDPFQGLLRIQLRMTVTLQSSWFCHGPYWIKIKIKIKIKSRSRSPAVDGSACSQSKHDAP